MEAKTMVDDLITITSRLVHLMETEIARLRAQRPQEIEVLQAEKASLARAYETLVGEMRKHPDLLAELAPTLREELTAKTQEFQSVLAENETTLRAAKEVNARVIKAIADAVAESERTRPGYSKSGTPDTTASGLAKATAVSVDETL